MKYVIVLLLGIAIGIAVSEYTTVYRMSCDVTKYGWMWTNQKGFSKDGFTCRNNENQQVVRETNLYMIYQVVRDEVL